jgi:hypothetical protein
MYDSSMLRLNGRPVTWLGVGAPDAVGSGIATLQNAVAQYGGAGRANPGDAVAGLKAAGQAAVKTLGPAIDALSGNSPNVMNSTQLAWQQNSALASLNSGPTGTQSDVDAAKAIVNQMISYYQQAATLATAVTPGVAPKPLATAVTPGVAPKQLGPSSSPKGSATPGMSPPDTSPPSSGIDTTTWIAIGCGVAAIVVGGIIVARSGTRAA